MIKAEACNNGSMSGPVCAIVACPARCSTITPLCQHGNAGKHSIPPLKLPLPAVPGHRALGLLALLGCQTRARARAGQLLLLGGSSPLGFWCTFHVSRANPLGQESTGARAQPTWSPLPVSGTGTDSPWPVLAGTKNFRQTRYLLNTDNPILTPFALLVI